MAKWIKKVKFKAKIAANSQSICKIFNAEVGFFKRLDVIHELLEVPLRDKKQEQSKEELP